MGELLHTPEGIRDIYGRECAEKLAIEHRITDVMKRYGYHGIQTPSIEYYDVLRKEIGTANTKELYKFFDREGNTLVLRPDFTPSIARVCSTFLAENNMPIRLRYKGSTFLNHSSYRGELKETTQLGAELIGDDSVEADAEVIAMVVECLKAIGLKEFQVSIGQNDYFKSIAKEAGFDAETEETLRHLIINRNLFGVENLLQENNVPQLARAVLMKLPELFGGPEILEEARVLSLNQKSLDAVERLKTLLELLKLYGADEHITFDFSMLGNYEYYTGVTFKAYTYGTGDAVIKGGRYDNLLEKFGKSSPAIGFAVVADELQSALKRQKKKIRKEERYSLLLYGDEYTSSAILLAQRLRSRGQNLELLKISEMPSEEKLKEMTQSLGIDHVLSLESSDTVEMVNLRTGKRTSFPLHEQ